LRITLNIDDDLYAQAVELTGVKAKTTLLHESLKALVERESARRLAALGGTEPNLESIPGRRSEPEQ